jgi:hypothetical protein
MSALEVLLVCLSDEALDHLRAVLESGCCLLIKEAQQLRGQT